MSDKNTRVPEMQCTWVGGRKHKPPKPPALVNFDISLVGTHLGQALNTLVLSRRYHRNMTNPQFPPWSWILSHQYAVSSIMHAFAGSEAFLNCCYEKDKSALQSLAKNDVARRRLLAAWRDVPVCDKTEWLLTAKNDKLSGRLANKLKELSKLRNLIVHGKQYHGTWRLQYTDTRNAAIADEEDDADFKNMFPTTKFSRLDHLNHGDALAACQIVFDCAVKLAAAYTTNLPVCCYDTVPVAFFLNGTTVVVESVVLRAENGQSQARP